MLIVNTDHGYLMGEHDWWAKMASPLFNEVAHVPFWVYDPRIPQAAGKRYALTQTMDVAPTVLDFFGLPVPSDMQGVPLKSRMLDDKPVREGGLCKCSRSLGQSSKKPQAPFLQTARTAPP